MTLLHVEYRLSPEHRLPTAVDDAMIVYRGLLRQNILPSQLFIMGDSAGGTLTLLTVQAILNQQLPVPRGILTLSPLTDFSMTSESYQRNSLTDVMLSYDYVKWLAKQATDSQQSELSPIISPLFGSFAGFPPMYVSFGTAEVLEDDSRHLVKKAQEAGVDVTFEVGVHMMHGYPGFFLYYPEASAALNHMKKWIEKNR